MAEKTPRQKTNHKYYIKNRKKILKKMKKKSKFKYRRTFSDNSDNSDTSESSYNSDNLRQIEVYSDISDKSPTLTINNRKAKNICLNIKPNNKHEIIGILDECKKERCIREISNKGEFFQIPDVKQKRDSLYICAPNQAGKTTYIARYLSKLKKNKNIFLFSKLDKDPILDKFNIQRINPYKYQLRQNTLKLFKNSLVIFDDIDQFHEKEISNKIYKTIAEILCNGAHFKISIIVTNHNIYDAGKTRTILNESASITIFPKSGCYYQLERMLRTYIGMNAEQIKKIKNLPSRWVTIRKHYPQTVIYQNGIYLL